MLDDPQFSFQQIGEKLSLTRQRIAQLAKGFGINGRQRERERWADHGPYLIKKNYPPVVHGIIGKLRHNGLPVLPYNISQPSRRNTARRSQRMVFVNGVLCAIQLRPVRKFGPYGHEYARFDVGSRTKRTKAAVFVMQKGRSKKLYVVPTSILRNVSYIYIPAGGKYAGGTGRKPQKDWTRYENAWHLLR